MSKRPDLSSLPIAARLANRPAAVSAPAATPGRSGGPKDATRDFKTVMARMNRAGWAEIRKLSTDLDTPMEDLIIQGLNDLLARHNRPAIIEKRQRPKDEA